jgi:hypothetical protein
VAQKLKTKKNSDLVAAVWQKIATNYCYKSLFLNLRNSSIYKGVSVVAER